MSTANHETIASAHNAQHAADRLTIQHLLLVLGVAHHRLQCFKQLDDIVGLLDIATCACCVLGGNDVLQYRGIFQDSIGMEQGVADDIRDDVRDVGCVVCVAKQVDSSTHAQQFGEWFIDNGRENLTQIRSVGCQMWPLFFHSLPFSDLQPTQVVNRTFSAILGR